MTATFVVFPTAKVHLTQVNYVERQQFNNERVFIYIRFQQ